MATQEDVRRIALSLPDAVEREDRFAFAVENKGKLKDFAWVWLERTEPSEPRTPRPDVVAIRVASQSERDELIASDPAKFFTEPHYNNFPAVLARLDAVTVDELEELITDGWSHQAPRTTVAKLARS